MLTVKRRKEYDPTNLLLAVKYAEANRASITHSARIFGVPRKTVDDHVKGRTGKSIGGKPGPEPMLTVEEETSLSNYLSYMANQGFPLTRSISRTFVQSIISTSGRPSLFSESGPSDQWFRKFLNRHPELQERRPERQERSRARMSNQSVMKQYFDLLKQTLERLELMDKPAQIFNVDESGFSGKEIGRERVMSQKGSHSYQQQVTTSDHITATVTVCANGQVLPSMVVFNKSFPHRNYKEGVPADWLFAVSESGYMDTELFKEWFQKVFLPNCGRARPVLLIMDNHDCHVQLQILELAIANEVEFLCLPPHTTHILQPLDVSLFGPIKAKFSNLASKLGFANSHMVIGKARFPFLLNHSLDQVCSPARVKESFRKTGIYPYSPEAIDKSQLVASSFLVPDAAPSSQAAPPSSSQAAPPSSSQAAPPSSSQAAPPSSSQAAPPSSSQAAPPSSSQSAPPSNSQAAPPSSSQAAPPSTSQAAPPSSSQAAPPSSSQAAPSISKTATPSSQTCVQSCPTCGNFLTNPLVAAGLIPPYLATILVPPKAPAPTKKSKAIKIARVVTGNELMESLREKEKGEQKKREEIERKNEERKIKKAEREREKIAKEQRKKEKTLSRMEAQREKERLRMERLEQKKKREERRQLAKEQAAERKRLRKRKIREIEIESEESESDHETLCKECGLRDPSETGDREIKWSTCEKCDEWCHKECIETKNGVVCKMCVIEE